jgi:hypothetical protein
MSVQMRSSLAIVLYLAPLALALAARSRRERPLWEIALDIPLLTAVDLLVTLLMARVVVLENAILVTRGAWLALGVAALVVARRRGRTKWPAALTRGAVALTALAALGSVALSAHLSRACHNADRAWHIPLVSSLQGQRLPFSNVYEPGRTLAYHYMGDIYAALFQTLSGRSMHASLALSIAHDIAFGLTGATLALLVLWMRPGRIAPVLLVPLTVAGTLLAGPLTLFRAAQTREGGGYNFINYLKLSFRPHVCLAGLLLVGFLGAVLVNLRAPRLGGGHPFRRTGPVLLASTALLAVTDETSIGVLGLALAAAWLVAPEVVHPARRTGLVFFIGLAVAVVLPNLVYVGSLAPGNPRHAISPIPWRSPGYYHPSLPLSTPGGRAMLAYDLFPMLAAAAGGLLCALRRVNREHLASLLFYLAALAVSVIGLCGIDVDHLAVENHRFITAAMLIFPLLGAFWLSAPRGRTPPVALAADALAAIVLLGAAGLSAYSTYGWIESGAPKSCTKPSRYRSKHEFFTTDCATDTAARLGERPRPTYMEDGIAYVYAGCHPVFMTGPEAQHWPMKIGLAKFGEPSLRELHREMVPEGEPLRVICPAQGVATSDPVCRRAREDGVCRPLGQKMAQCEVLAAARSELLARLAEQAREREKAKGPKNKPTPGAEPADDSQGAAPEGSGGH